MDEKLQRRVQRYGWDKAVPDYEKGWRHSLLPAHELLLSEAAPSPGSRVLDLAAGTGLVTFPLADAVGDKGCVIATDISGNMVEMLGRESTEKNADNIQVLRTDAEDLRAFSDGEFDTVTCALGLMYFPNPEVALGEALRVLKPGGKAVFAVWGARKNCGWADIFPIVDAEVQSAVCPLFFRLGTGGCLAELMQDLSFQNVKSERIQTQMKYTSDEYALAAAFTGGPVALAYSRFSDEVKHKVHAAYLASIKDYRTGKGYSIPGEFVVVSGYRKSAV